MTHAKLLTRNMSEMEASVFVFLIIVEVKKQFPNIILCLKLQPELSHYPTFTDFYLVNKDSENPQG